RGLVAQRVERHVLGAARGIDQADVERGDDRVVAAVGRGVAARARAVQRRRLAERGLVVDARHARDRDLLAVEQRLATGDGAARLGGLAVLVAVAVALLGLRV